MKISTLLLLALFGAGAYYLYTKSQTAAPAPGASNSSSSGLSQALNDLESGNLSQALNDAGSAFGLGGGNTSGSANPTGVAIEGSQFDGLSAGDEAAGYDLGSNVGAVGSTPQNDQGTSLGDLNNSGISDLMGS
jgi:hypothetical protein